MRRITTFLLLALLTALPAHAERIKDLAALSGVRNNQLIGYGLVVGLDGSGDQTTQTPFTVQSVINMLGNMGVTLPPGQSLQLKNVAAVMVTASLPAFARPGQPVDITVSSMGNAKSLRGGTPTAKCMRSPRATSWSAVSAPRPAVHRLRSITCRSVASPAVPRSNVRYRAAWAKANSSIWKPTRPTSARSSAWSM
jgi:hypothetical protein